MIKTGSPKRNQKLNMFYLLLIYRPIPVCRSFFLFTTSSCNILYHSTGEEGNPSVDLDYSLLKLFFTVVFVYNS